MESQFSNINLDDTRQDVHKIRKIRPGLYRYKVAEKLLIDFKGLDIVEIGGGAGEFTNNLIKSKYLVTFLDISESNIENALKMGAKSAHKQDLNLGIPLEDNNYDAVIMLEVIEHVIKSEFLLREIHRILKPGGIMILSTPNFSFILNRLRILFGSLSCDEGYHYRFFNPKSLRSKLKISGFDIKIGYYSSPAFFYNFIFNRILKKPRKHILVPGFLASLFAQTIYFKVIKT